jgi:hypothetical protein
MLMGSLLNSETYTKSRVFKAALLGLASLFWGPLVTFYKRILVEPVLGKIASDRVSDLVFGLGAVLLGLIGVALARRAYRPGHLQAVALTVPGLLYLAAALRGGKLGGYHWYFTQFSVASYLRYADILVLPLVGSIVLGLLARRQARLVPATIGVSYLAEDTPTTADTLGRDREAQRLMAQLSLLRPSTAFAVGIVGPWGSGKTKFLHLLAQHLPPQAIVIRFNPWLVESTTAIRKEFFAAFKDCLSQYSGELAAELGTYASSLAGVADSAAAKAFKEVVALLTDTPTLTEQFEKVNQVIGHLNRPIFIFLDDIDRLDKDEVLETLRLVRNTASFQRTIFVLAYDRAYVLDALQRTNQASSGQYLDKIVQLEVSLPGFSPAVLAERTLQLLTPPVRAQYPASLPDLTRFLTGRMQEQAARNASDAHPQSTASYRCYYPELITTMRGAVRFANLFAYDFLPLAGEVRLDEFLNLTLLKLRFPALYEGIKTQRVIHADLSKSPEERDTVLKLSRDKLTSFLLLHVPDEHERDLATLIAEHLFSQARLTADERTIQRPSTFAIYFSAGSFPNVSLADIERLRTGPPAAIASYLSQWAQTDGQLREAFETLTAVKVFNNRQDFENVVTATLQAGRDLYQVNEAVSWLLRLNAQRTNLAQQFYSGREVNLADWLTNLLVAAPAPYRYEADLLQELRAQYRQEEDFEFLLPAATLGDLAVQYLTQHLAAHKQADRTAFDLHWASVEAVDEQNMVLTDKRANTLLRQVLEANPLGDLPALLVPVAGPGNGQYQVFQPLLKRIFGSWDEFESFLARLPATKEATRIQQDFARFKLAGYQPYLK